MSLALCSDLSEARVAIVHDWLPLYGGAERVLEQIIRLFPNADVFSMVDFIPKNQRGFLQNARVRTSLIQKLPGSRKHYRQYLPIMPLLVEQFDLSKYDLVISSSYAVAKGVLTGPDQLHICYCHSPIRYAWDMQSQYLKNANANISLKGWLMRALLHYIRMWDVRTAHGVNEFIANSAFVGRRIRKTYGRDATVIYPPVDVSTFALHTGPREDYYITASRWVPYKKIDLIVEAFGAMPDKKLVVVGDGPVAKKIRQVAGPNIILPGSLPQDKLIYAMQRAKAFIFAAEEDFGIAPVEAQACGTPVIAFGKGGATETVIPDETGLFFAEQTAGSLRAAIRDFETDENRFDPTRIRAHAEQFSVLRFRREFAAFVEQVWNEARMETRGLGDLSDNDDAAMKEDAIMAIS